MVRPASISISPAIPSARQCQTLAQFFGTTSVAAFRPASARRDPTVTADYEPFPSNVT